MRKDNEQWLNEFLVHNELMNRSFHTISNYRFDLLRFINWFEYIYKSPITKVNSVIISDYQEHLKKGLYVRRPISVMERLHYWVMNYQVPKKINFHDEFNSQLAVASQKRHLSTLKNFFEFLKQRYEDKKMFRINPVKDKLHGIKLKDVDQSPTLLFRTESWNHLIESVHRPSDRLLLELLYFAGLRLSEATYLKWEHIDFVYTRLKVPRKGGKVHEWKPRQWHELERDLLFQLKKSPEAIFVFAKKSGAPYSPRAMYAKVMRALANAGLSTQLGPHSFRKACATELYLETKDLLYVRDYLNHSDAKVTQSYIDRQYLSERYLLGHDSPNQTDFYA